MRVREISSAPVVPAAVIEFSCEPVEIAPLIRLLAPIRRGHQFKFPRQPVMLRVGHAEDSLQRTPTTEPFSPCRKTRISRSNESGPDSKEALAALVGDLKGHNLIPIVGASETYP